MSNIISCAKKPSLRHKQLDHENLVTPLAQAMDSANSRSALERKLSAAVRQSEQTLDQGLTLLATVASSAPFVGLLGTVWGIYRTLTTVAADGQMDINAIVGPVGEALIMTCIGLGVAIPSVLAYNFFVRANRVTLGQFDEFAHDLHDYFATGARVGGGPQPTMRVQAPAAARPAAGKA